MDLFLTTWGPFSSRPIVKLSSVQHPTRPHRTQGQYCHKRALYEVSKAIAYEMQSFSTSLFSIINILMMRDRHKFEKVLTGHTEEIGVTFYRSPIANVQNKAILSTSSTICPVKSFLAGEGAALIEEHKQQVLAGITSGTGARYGKPDTARPRPARPARPGRGPPHCPLHKS